MLAADACVSPRGDLVVAVHSGLPDWGSGPRGKGKLYKIDYSDRDAPQPVLAWAAGPQEARVAFDRPLDPKRLRDLAGTISIEYGASVRPGDRFESLRPGYEVVARQMAAPRFELPILSAQVSADRRSLLLTTMPAPGSVCLCDHAAGLGSPNSEKPRPGELAAGASPSTSATTCAASLATWRPASGEQGWSGWLPHLDLAVARAFTAGSADHDRLWECDQASGPAHAATKLDLWQMLRPAVQPGSTHRIHSAGRGSVARRSRAPGRSR